jgi:hypothetical protein
MNLVTDLEGCIQIKQRKLQNYGVQGEQMVIDVSNKLIIT